MRCDREGKCIYVNPAFERVNLVPAETVTGKLLTDVLRAAPSCVALFADKLDAAMALGAITRTELSWSEDGKPVYWFVRVVPEFDADGKVSGAISIWSDVTERRQAEEDLRRYKDHLEETVQQRTEQLLLARDAAEAAN
jgi:PAS domain S-box-containing protein